MKKTLAVLAIILFTLSLMPSAVQAVTFNVTPNYTDRYGAYQDFTVVDSNGTIVRGGFGVGTIVPDRDFFVEDLQVALTTLFTGGNGKSSPVFAWREGALSPFFFVSFGIQDRTIQPSNEIYSFVGSTLYGQSPTFHPATVVPSNSGSLVFAPNLQYVEIFPGFSVSAGKVDVKTPTSPAEIKAQLHETFDSKNVVISSAFDGTTSYIDETTPIPAGVYDYVVIGLQSLDYTVSPVVRGNLKSAPQLVPSP